jgi:hypothetical protein
MEGNVAFGASAVTIAADDAVYVVNRSGVVTIRAENIGHLHRALQPHINGTHSEDSLLLVLPQRLQVAGRNYLHKLQSAGGITFQQASLPLASLKTHARRISETGLAASKRPAVSKNHKNSSLVSLRGPIREKKEDNVRHLFFVTPRQMGHELFWAGRRSHDMTYVVTSQPAPNLPIASAELEHRVAQARWLLSLSGPIEQTSRRLLCYESLAACDSLLKLLHFENSEAFDIGSIPKRLNLVTMLEVDQRPLVCLRAHHKFFPADISRFGVRYQCLAEELILEFIAQTLFLNKKAFTVTGRTYSGPRTRERIKIPAARMRCFAIAGSLLDARARALELDAQGRNELCSSLQTNDVLREKSEHLEVRYLQQLLRRRFNCLQAQCSRTEEGYFFFEAMGHRSCSIIRGKALRDLLLKVTWNTYYGSDVTTAAQIGFDFDSFIESQSLWRLVHAMEATLSKLRQVRFLCFHQQVWERTLWAAHVEADS